MATRYDVCVSEQGKDGKTYYTTIGTAFPSDKGHISIKLKAHPIGGEMVLFPAKPKLAGGNGGGGRDSEDTPF